MASLALAVAGVALIASPEFALNERAGWGLVSGTVSGAMLALSMVIRWPIAQFGWASASLTVARANCSSGQSRNAPPLAVRMIRSTDAVSSPTSAWNMAECSLSTGRMRAPCRAAST